MGGKSKTVNKPTRLTDEGQRQFDFAAGQLESRFSRDPARVGFSSAGINRGISDLRNFGPSAATNNRIDTLAGFRGTSGAKSSLAALGKFRGTGDAFRTLSALENFGREQANFDSRSLPLLQQAAEGKFLTQEAGNPFLAEQIRIAQRGSIESFNEEVLPNLFANFAGTGGVGSTLSAAFAAQQARDLQRNLGDISSNISFNVFEAERERQRLAQEAILGFESQGLERLLQSRITAGQQATALSQQRLDALSGRASGETQISGQVAQALASAANNRVQLDAARQQALQGALQGETSLAGLNLNTQQLNAQLESDRINQLLQAQEAARAAGQVTSSKKRRAI